MRKIFKKIAAVVMAGVMASVSAVSAFAGVIDQDVKTTGAVYVGDLMYFGVAHAKITRDTSSTSNPYLLIEYTSLSALTATSHESVSAAVSKISVKYQIASTLTGKTIYGPISVDNKDESSASSQYNVSASMNPFTVYGTHEAYRNDRTDAIIAEYTVVYSK